MVALRRRRAAWGTLLALWSLLLAACATVAPPNAAPAGPQGTSAEPTLTLWHALPPEQADILEGIAEEWASMQAQPVRIQLQRSPTDEVLHEKLLGAIQAQGTPTLAFVRPPDIAEYVAADALVPLDGLMDTGAGALGASDRTDLYTHFLEGARYAGADNALFAWPVHRYQTLLFLNRTRALEVGGAMPPESWDALVDLCAAHRAAGGESCLAAFPTGDVAVLWVWSQNGDIVADGGHAPAFHDEAGQAVMAWLAALRATDGVYLAPTYEANVEAFVRGETLFTFDSTAAIPTYEARINSAFDMAVLPPPSAGEAPVTVATGGNVAIFRSDPATEALAWGFLRYWTDTSANYRWANALGAYPVRRSALARLDAQWPDFSRLRQAAEWLGHARSEPLLAAWPDVERVLAEAMVNTINGQETPETALSQAALKAQGLLDP